MPAQVRALDGYVFHTDAIRAQCGEQEAMYASAGPHRRRCNPLTEADQRVLHRFDQDGRQPQIMTYTEHRLAWLADKWRVPTAGEGTVIMGYPPSASGLSPAPNQARFSVEKRSATAVAAFSKRFPQTIGCVDNSDDVTTLEARRDPSSSGGMERIHPA